MTAGDIAARFSCAWPTTTRHLRVLESAGLLTVTRIGREWRYELAAGRVLDIAGLWFSALGFTLQRRDEEVLR